MKLSKRQKRAINKHGDKKAKVRANRTVICAAKRSAYSL